MSKKLKVAFKRSIIISEIFIALASLFCDDYFVSFLAGTIFAILISFLIALVVAATNSMGNKKNTTTDINKDTQNFTYNKSDDYEKQAIFYYNEATYSGYRKALDLFSKAIICSTEKKHSLYYYRANVHLKLNILHNALDDINTALKYLHEQDTENIIKYLYTKGLIIQKIGTEEEIIDFWNYLISYGKYKCSDWGNNSFSVIENEYINNAKKRLEEIENNKTNKYTQEIHNILYNKYNSVQKSIYNVFFAFYSKKTLEVAEKNYELGLKEFCADNLDKAKEYFEYALSLVPYNKEYRECLKQIKKEEDKIIAEENKIENISSNNENVNHIKALMTKETEYVNIGLDYFNKNNFNTAIEYFNKAIEINPNDKYGYFNRANAYLRLKEHQNAINDYNKVIELDPTYSEAFFNRGLIYYDLKLYNKAINDYSIVLKLNVLDAHAYYLRGVAYLMNNMRSNAIKDFISTAIIDDSYVNRISEDTNINLMSTMNILEQLPYLSEEEKINIIQQIQEISDEDLGVLKSSQNKEFLSENISVGKNSIRKIDL